jgi:hypothetical protein
MKFLFYFILLFTSFGCLFGEASQGYPMLAIDEAHLQFQRSDGTEAPKYELAPTRGVTLDANGYKFSIPSRLKVDGPNSVQVLIGKDRTYHADWNPKDGKVVLDASNLKPMQQSQSFSGFQAGDTVIIGIGHSAVDGGILNFAVIWVGIAEIK